MKPKLTELMVKAENPSKHSQGFKYTLINNWRADFKIPKKTKKSEGKY